MINHIFDEGTSRGCETIALLAHYLGSSNFGLRQHIYNAVVRANNDEWNADPVHKWQRQSDAASYRSIFARTINCLAATLRDDDPIKGSLLANLNEGEVDNDLTFDDLLRAEYDLYEASQPRGVELSLLP